MHSLWSNADAERMVERYAGEGVARDLALRVYTSRLLGRDSRLVLHGGGNTSVKTVMKDLLDEEVEVLCVKGSGWDMAAIEPAGLPAVRLAPLRKLRGRAALADQEMVRVQRANLLYPGAPNPSVETLLHAFLPHKYIDHTHSTAVLSLADQPDAAERCADLYAQRMGLVPYIMPGFLLAKKAAEIFEADPAVDGLVLLKHGIFTFGDTAQEAYERMIAAVSLAEERLARRRKAVFAPAHLPAAVAGASDVAPILRGACAIADPTGSGAYKRFVLEFRASPAVLEYVNGVELNRYGQAGVATPDHTIRTKNYPLIVPAPEAGQLDGFRQAVREAVGRFATEYHAYFARHNALQEVPKRELDAMPRVILVPGLGLFGLGRSSKDARIAADIATARAMSGAGAEVALFDIDREATQAAAKRLGGAVLAIECDVTDPMAVRRAFDRVTAHFGGVDIVVSNAGAAWQGRIGEVDEAVLRRSFELNFFAHQTVAQNAVRIMLDQRTGGCLLFNVSKQAVNPGPNFGPYGLPKAATLALVRQYALDYGADGIRANAVNADRIKSGLLTPELIAARAKARGLDEMQYMAGNLLGREVTAEDVAQAFLHHAMALKTTADVTTVDGGNIAAALR
jgi:rhamnose utilization protein RhaD (predicted bifunctional aldolase and dehydrogenase)/NAD(P)-dependent dehydrogenase (short-subunit alcohol dehydrogenase family)